MCNLFTNNYNSHKKGIFMCMFMATLLALTTFAQAANTIIQYNDQHRMFLQKSINVPCIPLTSFDSLEWILGDQYNDVNELFCNSNKVIGMMSIAIQRNLDGSLNLNSKQHLHTFFFPDSLGITTPLKLECVSSFDLAGTQCYKITLTKDWKKLPALLAVKIEERKRALEEEKKKALEKAQ